MMETWLLYKDQFQNGGFLSQPFNMSFKLNTDGVAVFKSSKFVASFFVN